jgi:AcrR family transcriptional regulator
MDIRHRILSAAARVYAKHGYRGSTTRLIATEAGVNEVSIFRTFGSKDVLFEELACGQAEATHVPPLPTDAGDPERQLGEWCTSVLGHLTQHRSFLRKSMSEMEDRPRAAEAACRGPDCAREVLTTYVDGLRRTGRADLSGDADAAISMLMASLFADAMCREIMPAAFPDPAAEAPARYVRCFLRAAGVHLTSGTQARADVAG